MKKNDVVCVVSEHYDMITISLDNIAKTVGGLVHIDFAVKETLECVFGEGACAVLKVRKYGGIKVL